MNLQRFIDAKQDELRALRLRMPDALTIKRPDFLATLMAPAPAQQPLRVIAEYKQASPSEGIINKNLSAADVAMQYAAAGASCMSVLTEEKYFLGSLQDLHAAAPAGIPLLRKDFIFDPLQVQQSFSTPASAMLLIVALTPNVNQLRELREQAEEEGIHSVVEIFTEAELEMARASGARIIQVNARNLETFKTDREEGLKLAARRLDGECWIAASAMAAYTHLLDAKNAGYQAGLIGTALMRGQSPQHNLQHIFTP
ncbi:MAG: indole-3-glycerol-phosphate synthase [Akkermansia sp.]